MLYEELLSARRTFKGKLQNRELVFGGWVSYADVAITETFCKAGFDFVAIDMEHTTISLGQAKQIITSCQSENALCFPRPVSHTNDLIKPLLEAGADGLFIQMVETVEDVTRLLDCFKFPPIGTRSYGVNRAHGYGFDFDRYINDWNDCSSLVLQIESITAVENINDLLAFEHVDAVMIGPYDISGSLGVPGQTDHPLVRQAGDKVIEAAKRHGKSCFTQLNIVNEARIKDAIEQGFTGLILGSDLFVLTEWARQTRHTLTNLK